MKLLAPVLAVSLAALGGCASARTPGPAGSAPARTEAVRPPAAAEATPAHAPTAGEPGAWWHLDPDKDGTPGAGIQRAYDELLAGREPRRTVVVAIIDSGVDTAHADLRANLWVNPDEVAGNGRDDDANGYADDVHGWNFIGGADGRNVSFDTYEVTRLYAAGRERFRGAIADTLRGDARRDYEQWREAEAVLEARRDSTGQMIAQISDLKAVVDPAAELLRQQLGTDSLTAERVAQLSPMRHDVRRARDIFLQLDAQGITPAMIDAEAQRLQGLMEHGLNPDFDPRAIVGDDYADLEQRRYGNADVTGPDAMHGTHVAGIVGAVRGNGQGTDGVAPAVRLLVVRAVPDGDERDKDVANAIRYAVDNGAHIINMSFGKAWSPHKEAVDAAVRHAEEKGVLLVHAAGNDGADLETSPNFPHRGYLDGGSAANWIEVGAAAPEGGQGLAAPFSNYGRTRVDVFAPGVDIVSTVPGGGVEPSSGTSMAAPVVSGLAALLMAYFPELDTAQVKRILLESATRLPAQSVARPGDGRPVPFGELSATGGVVNAYRAVRMAQEMAGGR